MPAVNFDGSAGHEGAGIRRQKHERPVQIGIPSEPAHWDAAHKAVPRVRGKEVAVQVRFYVPRRDSVDANVVP